MIIKSFEFDQYVWRLNTTFLGNLNLIVGKNAVGKSKTLNAIANVAKFIKGEISGLVPVHRCRIEFVDESAHELVYSYHGDLAEIHEESMILDGKMIIYRTSNHAQIKDEVVNPPSNKLVIQSQRDTAKYPEFEKVMIWAEQTRGFSFSELSSSKPYEVPSMFAQNLDITDIYEKLDDEKCEFVKAKMRELGYDINAIEKTEIQQFKFITLKEEGLVLPLFSNSISNGMLRTFYILTYLAYISSVVGAKTLLIDDLGEGLDFSRSSRLSKMMFDYCEQKGIQLIVTSNDNFLMNAIDLSHWIILRRDKSVVSSLSNQTHPDMFFKFKKMGLNNFDMLSTDYIDRFLSEAKS